ncbi:MAG: hypothetical protein HY791_16140 [Deltaproteobacteria bacterium]|nr:hypothetical protein [Deltaproteobacteria bacterium]
MRAVEKLGVKLEAAFASNHLDESVFSRLAVEALAQARPELDAEAVLRSVLEGGASHEVGAIEGQLSIPLHRGHRFTVFGLFWLESSPRIVQNRAAGGLLLLQGSGIHADFRFEESRRVSSRLSFGSIRLESARTLGPGDVIPLRTDLARVTFHLERPCFGLAVTLEPASGHAVELFPPTVAYASQPTDPRLEARIAGLRVLRAIEPGRALEASLKMVRSADLETVWRVLSSAKSEELGVEGIRRLRDAFRDRFGGELADTVDRALLEARRRARIIQLRDGESDAELRFFLALILNLPSREPIDSSIRERFKDVAPRSKIDGWLEALSGVERIGIDLKDAMNRALLASLLDGRSDEQALDDLSESFSRSSVKRAQKRILDHRARIRRTTLEPLFR